MGALSAEETLRKIEPAERGLRAAREFLNRLPLTDDASRQAVDREFIGVDLIPAGLRALEDVAAELRASREALWSAALALRDISESSPNWMEPDAVSKSERRMRKMARAAYAKAEEAALAAGTEGDTWCDRHGHDFEPHEEDGQTRCTVCAADAEGDTGAC